MIFVELFLRHEILGVGNETPASSEDYPNPKRSMLLFIADSDCSCQIEKPDDGYYGRIGMVRSG